MVVVAFNDARCHPERSRGVADQVTLKGALDGRRQL